MYTHRSIREGLGSYVTPYLYFVNWPFFTILSADATSVSVYTIYKKIYKLTSGADENRSIRHSTKPKTTRSSCWFGRCILGPVSSISFSSAGTRLITWNRSFFLSFFPSYCTLLSSERLSRDHHQLREILPLCVCCCMLWTNEPRATCTKKRRRRRKSLRTIILQSVRRSVRESRRSITQKSAFLSSSSTNRNIMKTSNKIFLFSLANRNWYGHFASFDLVHGGILSQI